MKIIKYNLKKGNAPAFKRIGILVIGHFMSDKTTKIVIDDEIRIIIYAYFWALKIEGKNPLKKDFSKEFYIKN